MDEDQKAGLILGGIVAGFVAALWGVSKWADAIEAREAEAERLNPTFRWTDKNRWDRD